MPNEWSGDTLVPNAAAAAVSQVDNVLDLRTLPKREDRDYEIEAVSKARLVIETLVEEQPITDRALAKKVQMPKDTVMRTLRTYRLGGWTVRDETTLKWSVGPRLKRLATDVR